jgi:tRNA U34 5-methylaminomethyl-2-thiouridine-forming methyltransferase MnmC
MNHDIVRTADGSDTVYNPELNQHYHSTFGAMQESRHIFIETGFLFAIAKSQPPTGSDIKCLNILEIGFGTGLNALLTLIEAEKMGIPVHYTAIEAFPLDSHCWKELNYAYLLGSVDFSQVFAKLHQASWNQPEAITPLAGRSAAFTLHKIHKRLEVYHPPTDSFDLVYFDAFSPDVQPELWTEKVFRSLSIGLTQGGILVTYSVKGTVVRALRSAGFNVEKLQGPPGKRHILRAIYM